MAIALTEIRMQDAFGLDSVVALHPVQGPPKGSLATPHKFLCDDGKSYWLKADSQNGLSAELICGRLGNRLAVGPVAQIVEVPDAATVAPDLQRFRGVVVGTVDLADSTNPKGLERAWGNAVSG